MAAMCHNHYYIHTIRIHRVSAQQTSKWLTLYFGLIGCVWTLQIHFLMNDIKFNSLRMLIRSGNTCMCGARCQTHSFPSSLEGLCSRYVFCITATFLLPTKNREVSTLSLQMTHKAAIFHVCRSPQASHAKMNDDTFYTFETRSRWCTSYIVGSNKSGE